MGGVTEKAAAILGYIIGVVAVIVLLAAAWIWVAVAGLGNVNGHHKIHEARNG
jgi:hypothetical protein